MKSWTMTRLKEYLRSIQAPSRNAATREINMTGQELKDKTEALTARRDELTKDATLNRHLAVVRI